MRRTVWISLVTIAVVLVSVHAFGLPLRGTAQRALRFIGVPVTGVAQTVERHLYPGIDRHGDNIPGDTRTELNRLRSETMELERLKRQNRQLKEELDFVQGTNRETVTTGVVNYDPDQTRDAIRINAGGDHDIARGMPVVAQSALVGRVTDVSARTAEVVLVTDTTFRALAVVESGPEGILKGQIGGGLVLQQLPGDPDIETGDIVTTSGLDGTYPAGLLVGMVRTFARAPGEISTTARITPAATYRDLDAVTVIRTP